MLLLGNNFKFYTMSFFRLRFISYGGILKQYCEALNQDDVEMGDLIHELEKMNLYGKK